jgi:hypothetical protein
LESRKFLLHRFRGDLQNQSSSDFGFRSSWMISYMYVFDIC